MPGTFVCRQLAHVEPPLELTTLTRWVPRWPGELIEALKSTPEDKAEAW